VTQNSTANVKERKLLFVKATACRSLGSFSSEEHLDGAPDECAAHRTVTQFRWAGVTADEVSTRQKDRVDFAVHAHLARPRLS